MSRASFEDVDLWLDRDLWLDVKLTEQDRAELYKQEIVAWEAQCEALKQQYEEEINQSSIVPSLNLPPKPSYDSIRTWRAAVVISVHHRSILVRFIEPGLSNQLINVDEGHDRLAELYTRSAQDNQPITAGIDCQKLFDELLTQQIGSNDQPFIINMKEAYRTFSNRYLTIHAEVTGNKGKQITSPIIFDSDNDDTTLNDEEIQSQSISLPLYDPLTHERLNVPVRSVNCRHASAFDLMTHLIHNNETNSIIWLCPTCKQEALADQLKIDMFIYGVLQTLDQHATDHHEQITDSSCSSSESHSTLCHFKRPRHDAPKIFVNEQLVVDADGHWRVGQERDRRKRKLPRDSSTIQQPSASRSMSTAPSISPTSSYREPPFNFVFAEVYDPDHGNVIDLTIDSPYDAALCDWLSTRIKVKIEKQAIAKQAQIDDEAKAKAEAAERSRISSHSLFFNNPSPNQSSILSNPMISPEQNRPFQPMSFQAYPPYSMQQPHQPMMHPAFSQQHQQPPSVNISHQHQHQQHASHSAYYQHPMPYTYASSPAREHTNHAVVMSPTQIQSTQIQRSYPSAHHVPVQPIHQVRRPASIDVNTATAKDLTGHGISWTLASRIVEERARRGPSGYTSMKELCEVKGIGKKTVDKLIAHGVSIFPR